MSWPCRFTVTIANINLALAIPLRRASQTLSPQESPNHLRFVSETVSRRLESTSSQEDSRNDDDDFGGDEVEETSVVYHVAEIIMLVCAIGGKFLVSR
jgi:hypothetical protein